LTTKNQRTLKKDARVHYAVLKQQTRSHPYPNTNPHTTHTKCRDAGAVCPKATQDQSNPTGTPSTHATRTCRKAPPDPSGPNSVPIIDVPPMSTTPRTKAPGMAASATTTHPTTGPAADCECSLERR